MTAAPVDTLPIEATIDRQAVLIDQHGAKLDVHAASLLRMNAQMKTLLDADHRKKS